jgi:ubiquinone biosynthesis protein UbiJ
MTRPLTSFEEAALREAIAERERLLARALRAPYHHEDVEALRAGIERLRKELTAPSG